MLFKSVVLLVLIAVICWFTARIDKVKIKAIPLLVFSIFYIVLLVAFTLLFRSDVAETSVSLVPFESFFEILMVRWYGWGEYLFLAIVGNMLLFVPLGMIIGNGFYRKNGMIISLCAGFVMSWSIECVQCFNALGAFEVDDIIINTWGAVVGCSVVNAIRNKDKSAKNNVITLIPLIAFVVVLFVFCIGPLLKELIRLF